jgi:Mor family transcriptional regulator
VDGGYIYIPRKEENKMAWGELTQYKEELLIRNDRIYKGYLSGESLQSLSERYFLSPKTIQRIISEKRRYDNKKCAT